MLPLFFIFFLFSSPAIAQRRILHQPFQPSDSAPPSSPPSPPPPPPNPKYPFSTTPPVEDQSPPFFPSYPALPTPPSPASFASFPANITSLALPHSDKPKSSSVKLVVGTIVAVISAAGVVAVAVFFYCRKKRGPEFSDDKTSRSGTSRGFYPVNVEANVNGSRKVRTRTTSANNSSEFLYLGTLANSRGIDNPALVACSNDGIGDLGPRKFDSPELRPLPPLVSRDLRRSSRNNEMNSNGYETEEEFYSPRVSLGGQEESLCGTESGSRRVDSAVAAADENFELKTHDSSSCYSSSSSSSGSPARSHSISLSPPVSLSPRRSSPPKSPESELLPAAPVTFSSPENVIRMALDDEGGGNSPSPRISNAVFENARSPSLSPARLLPDSSLNKNPVVSMRTRDVSDPKEHSGLLSMPSSPPLGRIPVASPRLSNISDQIKQSSSSCSSLCSSPAGDLEKNPVALSRISSVSDQNEQSSSLSSSPDRGIKKILDDASPILPDVPDRTKQCPFSCSSPSSSMEGGSEKSPIASPKMTLISNRNVQSPVRISNALEQPISVPPPPPPPPQLQPRKGWEVSIPSTPTAHQPFIKPPLLIQPSRPFVLHTPTSASPIQLPSGPESLDKSEETPKPKLKPLHWDKVRASSDREMVWDQLRSSSFKLNEEMIETLFIVNTPNPKGKTSRPVLPSPSQDNRVLDPKKSQNIAISLRALNVTIEEVCDALLEGNAETLGTELLESLLKMAPTKEEERKLKEYKDDSPIKLGPAEKFLKAVLDVPFAFKRVDVMLYITNFESDIEYLKTSFETLEVACEELRNSRMFLKLLDAVLKTGNRMNVGTNRGDAHAFKLDTLLKLVDVKGADGKTTLLHFVVQEIIRTEGARLSGANQAPTSTLAEDAKCRKLGLQVVSALSSELGNVKKAAAMDSDVLSSDVSKLSRGIGNIVELVKLTEKMSLNESCQKFSESMNKFVRKAEEEMIKIQAQESVALSLVKEITEYFHGNSAKEEAHPFRIFMVVRDFLAILDRVCKEVGLINDRTIISSAHKFPVPVNPMLPVPINPLMPQIRPSFHGRRQYGSSDDESSSP